MPPRAHRDQLAAKRHVTLIVRVVVDSRGLIESGEVVDAESRLQERFRGWQGLTRTVRAWHARQEE